MTTKDQLLAIVCGGCGFGIWRESFGAGLFMAAVIFCLLSESEYWRARRKP